MGKKKGKAAQEGTTVAPPEPRTPSLRRLHVSFGWWALLCYLTVGIVLEAMHGFKVGWYLEPAYEVRRLTWTLGHAHGVLLALVNVAFGLTAAAGGGRRPFVGKGTSLALLGATVLLPSGFLLGGVFIHAGDPGLAIALVPVGALLLLGAVFSVARASSRQL